MLGEVDWLTDWLIDWLIDWCLTHSIYHGFNIRKPLYRTENDFFNRCVPAWNNSLGRPTVAKYNYPASFENIHKCIDLFAIEK